MSVRFVPGLSIAAIVRQSGKPMLGSSSTGSVAAEPSVDALLVALSARLKAKGLRLAGLVQHDIAASAGSPRGEMIVEDLTGGERVRISSCRGGGAAGCRLDAAGLAAAAGLMARALEGAPDLVLVSKFGRQEAEGGGVRDEIGQAVLRGLPLITSVTAALLPAFSAFVGSDWQRLPVDVDMAEAWCLDAARAAASASVLV